ncbi:MAG: hypothetical protein CMP34_02705 [Rickettsiales bacterium]|nr:hypothetical protein [Rickettsiales bacterium]
MIFVIKKISSYILILIVSMILFIIFDFFFSLKILSFFSKNEYVDSKDAQELERKYRVTNKNFHHGLLKNFSGIGVSGGMKYNICTNSEGFRKSCNKANEDLKDVFDYVFIGDSFTEGIGIDYEKTFVGYFEDHNKNLKILNLGVSGYSSSIYFEKIKYFLEKGIKMKNLIVFPDVSDVYEEGFVFYRDDKLRNIKMHEDNTNRFDTKRGNFALTFINTIQIKLPLTFYFLKNINSYISKKNPQNYLRENYKTSAWTYSLQKKNDFYTDKDKEKILNGINKNLKELENLFTLLKKKNINLIIGVYPWPGQILYDNFDSYYTKIWRNFCENKCKYFVDTFPIFFENRQKIGSKKTIDKFYIKNDVHHNKNGHYLIFKELQRTLISKSDTK